MENTRDKGDVEIMHEIFWIIENQLAGRRYPSTDQLRLLYDEGFRVVVALEVRDDIPLLEKMGYEVHFFEIEDYTAPDVGQIEEFVQIVRRALDERSDQPVMPVLVHCKGGYGRTGTMLAGYLIREMEYSAEDAIDFVRKQRPGAIEGDDQVHILYDYHRMIGGPTRKE
jgi:atypical dual specificity phosphatase